MNNEYTSSQNILKSLAILFIVWAHHFGHPLNHYFFSFHVPLLFFIAGMEIKLDGESNFSNELKITFRKIIVPYFIYSFILFGLWFVMIYLTGATSERGLSPVKNFIGIFYSQGMHEYMDWGMHMWFFPSLFITVCTAKAMYRYIPGKIVFYAVTAVLFLFGTLFFRFTKFTLPWSIDTAFVGLVFFIAGEKTRKIRFTDQKLTIQLLLLAVFFAAGFFLQKLNETMYLQQIDLKQHEFNSIWLFLISALSSLFFYLVLSQFISKYLRPDKPFSFGKINFYIAMVFIFHLRIWTVVNVAANRLLPAYNRTGIIETFILSILQILSIIIIVWILEKLILKLSEKSDRINTIKEKIGDLFLFSAK